MSQNEENSDDILQLDSDLFFTPDFENSTSVEWRADRLHYENLDNETNKNNESSLETFKLQEGSELIHNMFNNAFEKNLFSAEEIEELKHEMVYIDEIKSAIAYSEYTVLRSRIPGGASEPDIIELEPDEEDSQIINKNLNRKFLFKRYEREPKGLHTTHEGLHKREHLAWFTDRLFKFNTVPTTANIHSEINTSNIGSAQAFIEGIKLLDLQKSIDLIEKSKNDPESITDHEAKYIDKLKLVMLLAYILMNMDRNPHNFALDQYGLPVSIDNGATFTPETPGPANELIPNALAGTNIPEETLVHLEKIYDDSFMDNYEQVLSKFFNDPDRVVMMSTTIKRRIDHVLQTKKMPTFDEYKKHNYKDPDFWDEFEARKAKQFETIES